MTLLVLVLVVDAAMLAVWELLYLPVRLGGVPLPFTVLVAAVTTPLLVRVAARTGGGGLVAAAPLAAWVLTVLGFGAGGPGGDVLLPADWRSLALLACGMFPGAVALGRSLSPLPERSDARG